MIDKKVWKPWQLGRTQAMFRKYFKRKEARMKKIQQMLEALEKELRNEKQYSAADKLLPIIEEAEKDGWIPCSERRPKYNQDVLVYRPEMAMQILVDRYEGYYGEDDGEWYEGWYFSCNTTVLAWMPLPEPYKGE